jgi:hypothetical protein
MAKNGYNDNGKPAEHCREVITVDVITMSPKNYDSIGATARSMIITLTCLWNTCSMVVNGLMPRKIYTVISKMTLVK